MKHLIFIPLILVGCASNPPPPQNDAISYKHQNLDVDKNVQPLSRNEVITAINECEVNGTRAVMIYAKRKINGYSTDIVVEVTCAPKYRY
jgi:hypothetical protein